MEREVSRKSFIASVFLICLIVVQSVVILVTAVSSRQLVPPSSKSEYIIIDPITINQDYEFRNSYFTGSGTPNDPYVLSGVKIIGSDYCISISNTSVYIIIRRSFFISAGGNCISLYNVTNIRIEDSIIDQGSVGIISRNSSRVVFDNITCTNLVTGAILLQTDHVIVEDCSIYANQRGFILTNSSSTVLRNNRVFANREYGIYLDQSTVNCTVYANEIGWNREKDKEEVHNAFDDGEGNLWYNLSISLGNRWSDYNTTGDYRVEGEAASLDIYPLTLEDSTSPIIDSPQDIVISDTSVYYQIIWHPIEEYPYYYAIYREGKTLSDGYWDGNPIQIEIHDNQIGSYNYTIIVIDASGNTALDTVFSVVVFSLFKGVSIAQVIMASVLSVALVGLVIICIKRY